MSEPNAVIRLWEGAAPGAVGDSPEDVPTLSLYKPAGEAISAAVVICPGGGYGHLADHEGAAVARWLAERGCAGIVLKYRLAPSYRHPCMLADVQRAIRQVRGHAEEWKIDPQRVGIMGFSAGGHLASTAATLFDVRTPCATDGPDAVDELPARPDVAILCYPVIAMNNPLMHTGSRNNLLGESPADELADQMSTHQQITERTPPTFLFHTVEDGSVPVENAIWFALGCREKKVPFEMHLFEPGRHGTGLAPEHPVLKHWPDLLARWLGARGWCVAT